VNVDRTRALQMGLSQRDVAGSLLTSLSGSAQAAPNYWLNPKNGVNYAITVQTPTGSFDEMDDLANTPLPGGAPGEGGRQLQSVSSVSRGLTPVAVSHYNVQPVFDVLVSPQGTDLGSLGAAVERVVGDARKDLPRGITITVRGQFESMRSSFAGLAIGLVVAILLVYFLMVINFQGWIDPFVIIFAVPGALAGVVFMLLCTDTTFNVPSLMGAIMCVGVGTANSILVVTFANDCRLAGDGAREAAFKAGTTRLRPVLMTAAAMIAGMIPMSLGLGEGGEQNAPLGRAVIGGLLIATLVTVLVVPVIYAMMRRSDRRRELPVELQTSQGVSA
jgi:multidrug efflux pump subunit AcrB